MPAAGTTHLYLRFDSSGWRLKLPEMTKKPNGSAACTCGAPSGFLNRRSTGRISARNPAAAAISPGVAAGVVISPQCVPARNVGQTDGRETRREDLSAPTAEYCRMELATLRQLRADYAAEPEGAPSLGIIGAIRRYPARATRRLFTHRSDAMVSHHSGLLGMATAPPGANQLPIW